MPNVLSKLTHTHTHTHTHARTHTVTQSKMWKTIKSNRAEIERVRRFVMRICIFVDCYVFPLKSITNANTTKWTHPNKAEVSQPASQPHIDFSLIPLYSAFQLTSHKIESRNSYTVALYACVCVFCVTLSFSLSAFLSSSQKCSHSQWIYYIFVIFCSRCCWVMFVFACAASESFTRSSFVSRCSLAA